VGAVVIPQPLGALNDGAPGDCDITAAGATVRTLVVTAREDLQIAREARALLGI